MVIEIEIPVLQFLDLTNFPGVSELDKTTTDSVSEGIVIPDGLIFGNRIATLAFVSIFVAFPDFYYV